MDTPCVGFLELKTITKGILVNDSIIKKSNIDTLFSYPISQGKYIILFSGEVEDVKSAINEGRKIAGDSLIDSFVLTNIYPKLLEAIKGKSEIKIKIEDEIESFGILETNTCSKCIISLDKALKTSKVRIVKIHLGKGIAGKAYFIIEGEVGEIESAIAAAIKSIRNQGIIDKVIIPRASIELLDVIQTGFNRNKMQRWITSTFIFLLLLTIYFYKTKEFDKQIKKAVTNQEKTVKKTTSKKSQKIKFSHKELDNKYSQWIAKAKKAEKEKKFSNAILYYMWALNIKYDSEIEKNIKKIEQHIEKERLNKTKIFSDLEYALELEKSNNFIKAIRLYKKVYEKKILDKINQKFIQNKIQTCEKVIKEIKFQDELWNEASSHERLGNINKAIEKYKKIYTSDKLADKRIEKLQILKAKAKNKIEVLYEINKNITKFTEEYRVAQAYNYLKQIAKKYNLYLDGIIKKNKELLLQEMVFIPEGPFIIGDNRYKDESPERTINLKSFYIDKYELTNKKYLTFVNITGYELPAGWKKGYRDNEYPVSGVSWQDASRYCKWAGKRLPTEFEWEKAARGTKGYIYPWGNKFRKNFCNSFEVGIKKPSVVGKFPQGVSPYGCHDMTGNIMEWTDSPYKSYTKNKLFLYRPDYKIARGGSWYYKSTSLRCSNRYPYLKDAQLVSIGFRCAKDTPQILGGIFDKKN